MLFRSNDKGQSPKNEIKVIITPDHAKYNEYMQPANGRYKIGSRVLSHLLRMSLESGISG